MSRCLGKHLFSRLAFSNSQPSTSKSTPVTTSLHLKKVLRSASTTTKLAVLDDYQNLSPRYFSAFSKSSLELTTFTDTIPASEPGSLVKRLQPFDAISIMRERTPFPREVIRKLPNLRLLLTTGIRNHCIDVPACQEAGIVVAGTTPAPLESKKTPKGYQATTQHTWALILALANNVPRDYLTIKAGGWQKSLPLGLNLAGKTFGCLGLGRLGTAAARIAVNAFGMNVLAWSTSLTQEIADAQAQGVGLSPGSFRVAKSKAELFEQADVLSIHYVLSSRSQDIVSGPELDLMKPTALLVNSSRGPLINENAFFEVLDKGKIRGAAMDVHWIEPVPKDSRWRTTKWGREEGRSEVVMTPHTGFVSEETMAGWWSETRDNVARWTEGKELLHRIDG